MLNRDEMLTLALDIRKQSDKLLTRTEISAETILLLKMADGVAAILEWQGLLPRQPHHY